MIKLADLQAQVREIEDELVPAVTRVIRSGWYALGPEVEAFEKEFAEFCNVSHGAAVNSGTSALHLALEALGIGKGDEVITVPFTFVATVSAILYAGAKPIFADIRPDTYTMDADDLKKKITKKTKAIIPVHLYGQPADMDEINAIARKHGIPVIEDAAQAHGALYKGKPAGSLGDLACFSFYPAKNLGACGEGGIVVSNNNEWIQKVKLLRCWGEEVRYYHKYKGYNYRMDAVQGAALRVKLRHLNRWNERRQHLAKIYDERLTSGKTIEPPAVAPGRTHVYHLYIVRCRRDRDKIRDVLNRENIQNGLHYPVPIHLQEAYRDLGYQEGDFPVAEQCAKEVLTLPLHPQMTDREAETVGALLAGF